MTQFVTGYQFQGTVTGGLVASNFTPSPTILGLRALQRRKASTLTDPQ